MSYIWHLDYYCWISIYLKNKRGNSVFFYFHKIKDCNKFSMPILISQFPDFGDEPVVN